MENEKTVVETLNSDNEEIIIEEVIDDDDDAFLKSLEEIDEEENSQGEKTQEEKEKEEAQRIKNKNAEEARKRREAEAKAKAEAEAKAKAEEEAKAKEEEAKKQKEEVEEEKYEEEDSSKYKTPQEQVKELVEKYPDIDLKELDNNKDFQEYVEGKWVKGGKTITQLYENFIDFKARVSNKDKEEISKNFKKQSGPSIKGSGGGNGGNSVVEGIFTKEELKNIQERLPFMKPQEYAKIEEKLDRSIKYYKKNS